MSDINVGNVDGMGVVELRAELKSRGLDTKGRKAELHHRLTEDIGAGRDDAAVAAALAAPGFTIAGATGNNAHRVNGTFSKTDEIQNGKPVYSKDSDANLCCYYAMDDDWYVTDAAGKDANNTNAWASTAGDDGGLVAPQLAILWDVVENKTFVRQKQVTAVNVAVADESGAAEAHSSSSNSRSSSAAGVNMGKGALDLFGPDSVVLGQNGFTHKDVIALTDKNGCGVLPFVHGNYKDDAIDRDQSTYFKNAKGANVTFETGGTTYVLPKVIRVPSGDLYLAPSVIDANSAVTLGKGQTPEGVYQHKAAIEVLKACESHVNKVQTPGQEYAFINMVSYNSAAGGQKHAYCGGNTGQTVATHVDTVLGSVGSSVALDEPEQETPRAFVLAAVTNVVLDLMNPDRVGATVAELEARVEVSLKPFKKKGAAKFAFSDLGFTDMDNLTKNDEASGQRRSEEAAAATAKKAKKGGGKAAKAKAAKGAAAPKKAKAAEDAAAKKAAAAAAKKTAAAASPKKAKRRRSPSPPDSTAETGGVSLEVDDDDEAELAADAAEAAAAAAATEAATAAPEQALGSAQKKRRNSNVESSAASKKGKASKREKAAAAAASKKEKAAAAPAAARKKGQEKAAAASKKEKAAAAVAATISKKKPAATPAASKKKQASSKAKNTAKGKKVVGSVSKGNTGMVKRAAGTSQPGRRTKRARKGPTVEVTIDAGDFKYVSTTVGQYLALSNKAKDLVRREIATNRDNGVFPSKR